MVTVLSCTPVIGWTKPNKYIYLRSLIYRKICLSVSDTGLNCEEMKVNKQPIYTNHYETFTVGSEEDCIRKCYEGGQCKIVVYHSMYAECSHFDDDTVSWADEDDVNSYILSFCNSWK